MVYTTHLRGSASLSSNNFRFLASYTPQAMLRDGALILEVSFSLHHVLKASLRLLLSLYYSVESLGKDQLVQARPRPRPPSMCFSLPRQPVLVRGLLPQSLSTILLCLHPTSLVFSCHKLVSFATLLAISN